MTVRSLMLFCGFLGLTLFGCYTAEESDLEDHPTLIDNVDVEPSVASVIPATPEMIDAALNNKPLPISTAQLEACHHPTPCPPEYGSCASWSSSYTCGYTVDECSCVKCTGAGCFVGNLQTTTTESYRVCFNTAGQSCTEYTNSASSLCSLVPKCE